MILKLIHSRPTSGCRICVVVCVCLLAWVGSLAAATHTVVMQNNRFVPSSLTIPSGDTVVWVGGATIHTVTGTGSDPFCGGQWVYDGQNCSKTFATAGTFNYRCSFHGNFGMTGTIRVTAPNTPPTTSITNLVSGTVFATDAVFTLRATASDGTNGSISLVEFLDGSTLLGSRTNTPYNLTVSNFTAGVHILTSRATDNQGATGTSPQVSITVVTPSPVTLTSSGVTNGAYQLTYSVDTGLTYVLQASTNLVDWLSIATNKANSSSFTFTDTSTTNLASRFYRVRRVP